MTGNRLPIAALVVAAFLFGITFVIVKGVVAGFPPLAFVGWRFAAGAAVLLVLAFPSNTRVWRDGCLAGVLLFVGFVFQTEGLRHTDATNSALVTGLYVVFTPLLVAAWSRRRPSPWVVVGVVAAFVGLVLLTFDDDFRPGPGDLLTLVCAVAFAAHIAFLARTAPRHPVIPFTGAQLAVTALLALAGSAALEGFPLPSGREWGAIALTGVGVSAGAYLLQVWAQTRIGPSRTAVLLTLEPVFALAAGAIVLGERLDARGWLGAVVILAAIQLVLHRDGDSPATDAEAISPV
jgi:drug/metabolite transporter (DMT)-like permease